MLYSQFWLGKTLRVNLWFMEGVCLNVISGVQYFLIQINQFRRSLRKKSELPKPNCQLITFVGQKIIQLWQYSATQFVQIQQQKRDSFAAYDHNINSNKEPFNLNNFNVIVILFSLCATNDQSTLKALVLWCLNWWWIKG